MQCFICNDTGWAQPYCTPRNGILTKIFTPCSHDPYIDTPDHIEIPFSGDKAPIQGTHYVVEKGTCTTCGSATRNGVCLILSCPLSPQKLNSGSRVWALASCKADADDGIYMVCDDHGDGTMTLITYDHRKGRMLIRTPRAGWAAIGFPPFPIETCSPDLPSTEDISTLLRQSQT